jgi:hypothetical protein
MTFFLNTYMITSCFELLLTKVGWATFWAIFYQAHQVTLLMASGKTKMSPAN